MTLRHGVLQGCRLALLAAIVLLIRHAHQTQLSQVELERFTPSLSRIQSWFPSATHIDPPVGESERAAIRNDNDVVIGYTLHTLPNSRKFVGYSGSTHCLILLDSLEQIVGIDLIASEDTIEHVNAVFRDTNFLSSIKGLSSRQSDRWTQVDTVSGATLTSIAVAESIADRLGVQSALAKFDNTPRTDVVGRLFPEFDHVVPIAPYRFDILAGQKRLGSVVLSSPLADSITGYQGPTNLLIALDREEALLGIAIHDSYDNQPYVNYIDDDWQFQELFRGRSLTELSRDLTVESDQVLLATRELDSGQVGEPQPVEGVSGATMSGYSILRAIKLMADRAADHSAGKPKRRSPFRRWLRDALTAAVLLMGLFITFARPKLGAWPRRLFLVSVILLLGFVTGDLLSVTLFAGWSRQSIPWQSAPGLVALALAAFLVPLLSKRNIYCDHLCPFGALQQLTKNRGPRIRLARWANRAWSLLPFLLLVVTVLQAIGLVNVNLASLEPFDAFAFRIAGWVTIAVAAAGLLVSFFIPMAYCRFGCPTGAILSFVRLHAKSDQIGTRDILALLLTGLATLALLG